MKNYAGYTQVYIGFQGAGRAVYVKNDMVEIVQHAMKKYRTNYHLMTVFRQIVGLNADPSQGHALNPANDARRITTGNVTLKYYLFNGVVFIQLLAIGGHSSAPKVALYRVAYDQENDTWLPSKDPVNEFDRKSQWKSKGNTAHYAAVAGRFEDNVKAGELLIEHLTGAYGKEDYLTTSDAKGPYSMLWIGKGQHKKPEAAQQLASLVQQSTLRQLPVNWLIHGEGAHTFKNMAEALKVASAKPSSSKTQQNVYFSNPSIESENKLKQWCADAGMHFVGLNRNERDLRRWSTLKNVGIEMSKAAAMGVALNGTLSGVDGFRPFGGGGVDVVVKDGVSSLVGGDYFTAAVCAIATGFLVVGMAQKLPAVKAGIRCTFGKGNQRWYVSDKDLG